VDLRRSIVVLVLGLFHAAPGVAQNAEADSDAPARAEVLVLGVYHMANPGRDVANVKADDVLAPERQAEIAELMEVLEEFGPTKVAVEASFSDAEAISARYQAYRNGERELTRNETEQIGFRLAGELGHETVYAVDADGEFPFPRVQDYASAHGREQEFDEFLADLRSIVRATDEYLGSHTVLETLRYMNSDDYVAQSMASDYRIARFGEPWNWAGPDLVSDWFRRNMRIYSNILQLIESPDERVLVVFGAGHLGWLRHDFDSDPAVRLRKLSDLTENQAR